MIEGLSHLTFIVKDIDRMEAILTAVLGAERVYDSGDRTFSLSKERFFVIGGVWIATMEGEEVPHRSYNHVAFKISEHDYNLYLERIRSHHLELHEGRPRVKGEGRSLYFYDDDNHLFELHTGTLDDRLERYAKDR